MPRRFVLLRHECPAEYGKPNHWDFMLEADGTLMTWELRQLPAAWSSTLQLQTGASFSTVPAVRLEDHRLAYLDYEGSLTGDRGSVRRVVGGTCDLVEQTADRMVVDLHGDGFEFRATLAQTGETWAIESRI